MRIAAACAVLAAMAAGAVHAQDDPCSYPSELGQVVLPSAPCHEILVRYEDAKGGYNHDVLGDGHEYTSLFVQHERHAVRVKLPVTMIFEDLAPRVANLDDDPEPEIVTVEAIVTGGARLAVFDVELGTDEPPVVTRLAAINFLRTRFRWISVVGIADFDGDGQNDIAYVETPHLGKTLRIVTLRGGGLEELASAEGFSNHIFGEPLIQSGVRDCGAGAEAVLGNGDWTQVVAVRLVDGELVSQDLGPYDGPSSVLAGLSCEGS